MTYTALKISPIGGCTFSVGLVGDADDFDRHLGTIQVGEIDDNEEWDGDDDEVIEAAYNAFGARIPDGLPIVGWP